MARLKESVKRKLEASFNTCTDSSKRSKDDSETTAGRSNFKIAKMHKTVQQRGGKANLANKPKVGNNNNAIPNTSSQ